MTLYLSQSWKCSKCCREFTRSRQWEEIWSEGTLGTQQPWIFECKHIHELRTETVRVECPDGKIFVYDERELV